MVMVITKMQSLHSYDFHSITHIQRVNWATANHRLDHIGKYIDRIRLLCVDCMDYEVYNAYLKLQALELYVVMMASDSKPGTIYTTSSL